VADLRVVVQESENKDNIAIGRAVLVPPGWNMTYPEGTTTEAHGSHQITMVWTKDCNPCVELVAVPLSTYTECVASHPIVAASTNHCERFRGCGMDACECGIHSTLCIQRRALTPEGRPIDRE